MSNGYSIGGFQVPERLVENILTLAIHRYYYFNLFFTPSQEKVKNVGSQDKYIIDQNLAPYLGPNSPCCLVMRLSKQGILPKGYHPQMPCVLYTHTCMHACANNLGKGIVLFGRDWQWMVAQWASWLPESFWLIFICLAALDLGCVTQDLYCGTYTQ